ncbi:MAG: hypothetical protein JWP81_1210 [Ferruginibacter sp.]|nr:hypothetical protein [Ferruginibacter sp.]
MKKQTLLTQFEYSIFPPAFTMAGIKSNYIVAEHLPILKVTIDFENGNLKLEGDWHFMMVSNKHNEPGLRDYHKGRVQIETALCNSLAINLNDARNDGLIFRIEGTIKESGFLGPCSGLLVLDNVRAFNGLISDQWNISFYLYDQQLNDCEIKFKLPVYITDTDGNKN